MLSRSPSATSPEMGAESLATGRLSPVSAASAVLRDVEWITRASAGTVSPSSIRMMSPGTISAAGTRPALAIAHHVRVRGGHLLQRRHGGFRPRLLDVTHAGVQQLRRRKSQSLRRAAPFPAHTATAPRRCAVAINSRITSASWNWARNFFQAGFGLFRRQLVPAVTLEPCARLRLAHAAMPVAPKRGEHLSGLLPVRNCLALLVRHGAGAYSPGPQSAPYRNHRINSARPLHNRESVHKQALPKYAAIPTYGGGLGGFYAAMAAG